MRKQLFIILLVFLVIFISGCSDTDYIWTTTNTTVINSNLNVTGIIYGFRASVCPFNAYCEIVNVNGVVQVEYNNTNDPIYIILA